MIKEVGKTMGFAKKRVGKDGRARYTAVYLDLRGSERSAGTFANEKAADRAWQQAEVELRQGRLGDPARGRQTFRNYVEEQWLPNHVLEPTTREKYTYYLGAHIIPELGPIRMTDIFPEHIREWIAKLQHEGQSAWTIQYCKSSILSSIFTTALNDRVTYIHPCRGVRIPTVPDTPRTIITPEQFDAIYAALPSADARLLVETAIESGLRWGELTELRVRDLDLVTRMLTVSRKATELNRGFHPEGKRFLVSYPKDKEYRRLKLSPQISAKLQLPHQDPRPGPARPAVPPARTSAGTAARCRRRFPPLHRAERRWPSVPARDAQRLQRREMQVPALPARVRGLPGRATRGARRLAASGTPCRGR